MAGKLVWLLELAASAFVVAVIIMRHLLEVWASSAYLR